MSDSRVTMVLGASGGIGTAVSKRLAASGDRLVLCGRDEARLSDLAGDVGGESTVFDARDFEQVSSAVEGTVERFGQLDAVINCVGSILLRPAHLTSKQDFDDVLATNLTSAFAVVRAASRVMMAQKGGSIVLFSSAAGRLGLPSHEAIAAAKAGVDGLVRAAAATYGRAGVRVNAVAPGLVETPATERITGNAMSRTSSEKMHALGRIGQPEDVASAIEWLLMPEASWVTGQVIGVDGGLATARSG